MKIDDTEVPEAVIGCWKDLLDKSGDADLAALCEQHKDLWAGFRPGKAPDRGVAPRAKANLGGVTSNDQTLREQLTLGVDVDAYGCPIALGRLRPLVSHRVFCWTPNAAL